MNARPDFQTIQDEHWNAADPAHFHWTTHDPAFAPVEDELLAPALGALGFPCLEVGCGEGTNLVRLAGRGAAVGIDRHPAKARFAAGAVPHARLAAGDALGLPFARASFRGVLVRDLLHHLEEPRRAVAEIARVLAPGGTLVVIESNGANPLVALQARLVAAEAGLRTFRPQAILAALADQPFSEPEVRMAQGFPLRRLVLHPHYGMPALGRLRPAARALAVVERVCAGLTPRARWSYAVVRATRLG